MSVVQVIPLGGVGEIGKNCTVVRQDDDLIVVDVGLSFPNEEMLGVDIVIPDFTYLVENKDKIRGVFLTHAHEDHVGALPYLLERIKVPIYGTQFTLALLRSKLEERVGVKDLDFRTMDYGDVVEAGSLSVEPIRVTHSIPESSCLAVRTRYGIVFFTGDFKFDFTPVDGKLTQMNRIAEIGDEGVLVLLSDSTNVERPGWGPSERDVTDGFRSLFPRVPGRILITTFASNIHRMQQAFTVASETGRKVAVAGRRMEQSIDVCVRLGYLQIPRGTRIRLDEVRDYPPEQLVILTTGSQGEPQAALSQMSRQEYSRLRIQEGDTVIYSARPIPGNEAAIWRTVNRLFLMGARVIYDSQPTVHVSGHAYQEELKMMINLTRPYYLAPVHGEPRHQHLYLEMGRAMGYPEHRLFKLKDGDTLHMDEQQAWIGEPVTCGRVLVDNAGTPGIPEEVLRDRWNLAQDGIVTVTVAIDVERGEVVGDPVIQSKGFSGSDDALQSTIDALADALRGLNQFELQDVDAVRHTVADTARRYLLRKTQLRPIVVPTVIEV
jgi:ribonuclease J